MARASQLLPSDPPPSRATAIRRWLTGTFTGRALVFGALVKLIAFAFVATIGSSPRLDVLDTIGDIGLVAGAVVLGYRLYLDTKRHLLWRVRRKLTLSYIFIGFVPALLIITFFLLCGWFVLNNISSYMMRTRLGRLVAETQLLAQMAAIGLEGARSAADVHDALARRQRAAASRYPTISYALVRAPRVCGAAAAGGAAPSPDATVSAGPWAHAKPPSSVPAWVPCEGYASLTLIVDEARRSGARVPGRLAPRAVAWVDGTAVAVVVDLPMTSDVTDRLRDETGIDLKEIVVVVATDATNTLLESAPPADRATAGATPGGFLRRPLEWMAFFDWTDWKTGKSESVPVPIRTSVADIYERVIPRIGNFNFGQGLMLGLAVVGALFLIIQAVAFAMGLALARSITGSVHELFAGTERVRRGEFTHKIAIRSRDQLGELAASFNSMTASIEDLLQQKAEKERMEQELRIARSIQMSLLPQGPMIVPGLSLTAHCEPAREVGGDYYDFLPIDEHTLGIIVADVSGKGTSAALYMAELKGIVLSLSQRHTSPRDLLIEADRIISRHLDARSFITVTYLLVDLRARTLRYARAGHCPLIYMPGSYAASRTPQLVAPEGLVLGLQIDGGQMFRRLLDEVTLPLAAGDLFVLYTDGMSEAMNPAGDCFGDARLAALVGQHPDMPSDELRERILREVGTFAGSAAQHDDMTMVFLRVDETVELSVLPLQAVS